MGNVETCCLVGMGNSRAASAIPDPPGSHSHCVDGRTFTVYLRTGRADSDGPSSRILDSGHFPDTAGRMDTAQEWLGTHSVWLAPLSHLPKTSEGVTWNKRGLFATNQCLGL